MAKILPRKGNNGIKGHKYTVLGDDEEKLAHKGRGTMPACEMSYGQGLVFGEHQLGHPKLPLDRGERTDKEKISVYNIGKSNIG